MLTYKWIYYLSSNLKWYLMLNLVSFRLCILSREQFFRLLSVAEKEECSTASHGPLKPVRNLVMLLTGMIGNAVPGWLITYFHFLSCLSNKSMHFKSPLSIETWAQNTGWASSSTNMIVVWKKDIFFCLFYFSICILSFDL